MLKLLFPIMLFCSMFVAPFYTEYLNEHHTFHYDEDMQTLESLIAINRPTDIIIPEKRIHHVHKIYEFVHLSGQHGILQENQQSKQQDRFQLPVQFQSSYLSTLLI